MSLLQFSPVSIYCPASDIHIDPWTPVDKAIITHAHSDHARPGCKHYMAHKDAESVLRLRLGEDISLQTVAYGEPFTIQGVRFSLHPAGHIIGSSQVRVEKGGEVWVAGGDFKLQDDLFCQPFEPLPCHVFISESTFGLPIYKWPSQEAVIKDIRDWWQQNSVDGKTSVLMGYALGKMQRLIRNLHPFITPVFAHGAVFNINEKLRAAGFDLPLIPFAGNADKKELKGALVFAPPSAVNSSWLKRFDPYSLGYCSGWMAIRGAKNRRAVDRGFVLSDHADWNDLNTIVEATGAEKFFITHGYTDVFARWLKDKGYNAEEVTTRYGDELEEQSEPNQS